MSYDINDSTDKTAIALEYDGTSAPTISATGTDETAQQIVALALEHGVPLYENPELASLLTTLELGESIPENLYVCIAQIIAFAYKIRGKAPEGWEAKEEDYFNSPIFPNNEALLPEPEAIDHEESESPIEPAS